ncbi:uncharacterized protein LOC108306972 [Cebus imitator]|uniref:uncharacterized protein LOC108306972 n=1 Tax=Cebus imitator TaxID=2715852 RepID=UPI000809D0B5|nr:uncharacterized protein LOC108306972 [Cebus imitator]
MVLWATSSRSVGAFGVETRAEVPRGNQHLVHGGVEPAAGSRWRVEARSCLSSYPTPLAGAPSPSSRRFVYDLSPATRDSAPPDLAPRPETLGPHAFLAQSGVGRGLDWTSAAVLRGREVLPSSP